MLLVNDSTPMLLVFSKLSFTQQRTTSSHSVTIMPKKPSKCDRNIFIYCLYIFHGFTIYVQCTMFELFMGLRCCLEDEVYLRNIT